MEVSVYSSCERVELFLNKKSLGIVPTNRSNQFTAVYQVPYQPGELMAAGYNGNDQTPMEKKFLYTAGTTTTIQLTADRTVLKSDRSGPGLYYSRIN